MEFDENQPHSIFEWRTERYAETQDEFAKRIGVNVATLSSWETGKKSPRLRTRRQVAQKLGKSLYLIVYPKDETKKPPPAVVDDSLAAA